MTLAGPSNEMTGDGIMALFGAPAALEDAPPQALRSALAIHLEIARFNRQKNAYKAYQDENRNQHRPGGCGRPGQ